MVVNAISSAKMSKLKNILTDGATKISPKGGYDIIIPQNAQKYDFSKGTGKKGDYVQYVFKDTDGKPVQHLTRYSLPDGAVKDVITDFERNNSVFNVIRKILINGKNKAAQYSSFLPQQTPSGEFVVSKSFMSSAKNSDKGGLELLRIGKKPVGIEFKFNWDGTPAKIKYKNAGDKKLELTDEEKRYLPFIPRRYVVAFQNNIPILGSSDFCIAGAQKKIGLAQIIQEKLHNIEGIMPRAKSVEIKDLHLVKSTGKTPEQLMEENGFVPLGEHLGNGQINIVTNSGNNSDGVVILDLISHEMQHASDNIKMYRGAKQASDEALKRVGITLEDWNKANEAEFSNINAEEYMEKVIEKKGLAKKGTPEYEEAVDLYEMNFRNTATKDLKSIEQHDALPLEQRAIDREKQQLEFYTNICQKITNFLASFVG